MSKIAEQLATLELLAKSESKVRLWLRIGNGDPKDANDGRPLSAEEAIFFINTSTAIANDLGQDISFTFRREDI